MGQMKRVASGDPTATSKLVLILNRLGYPPAGDRFVDLVWRTQQRPGKVLTVRPPEDDAGQDAVPAAPILQAVPAAPPIRTAVDVAAVGPPPPPQAVTETPQAVVTRLGLRTAASLRRKKEH